MGYEIDYIILADGIFLFAGANLGELVMKYLSGKRFDKSILISLRNGDTWYCPVLP